MLSHTTHKKLLKLNGEFYFIFFPVLQSDQNMGVIVFIVSKMGMHACRLTIGVIGLWTFFHRFVSRNQFYCCVKQNERLVTFFFLNRAIVLAECVQRYKSTTNVEEH